MTFPPKDILLQAKLQTDVWPEEFANGDSISLNFGLKNVRKGKFRQDWFCFCLYGTSETFSSTHSFSSATIQYLWGTIKNELTLHSIMTRTSAFPASNQEKQPH